jgi:hypothetical protein
MNRKVAIALLAATVNVAIATASAQTIAKANIPFNFRVGSTLMPAGEYRIEPTHGAVWINKVDGKSHAVALAQTGNGSTAAPAKLVFHRYGENYFLRELLTSNGQSEMTLSQSKLEKRAYTEEANLHKEGQVLIALKK